MRRLAIFGLVVAVAVLTGQKKQKHQETTHSSKLVTLNVSAAESSGARPGDLTEADFQVFEDGKPQKIVSFVKNDGRGRPTEKLAANEFSNRAGAAIPHATL